MKLENKVVVITGGGSGIGRQLVLQSLKAGAEVAAVDINTAALEETSNLAGELAKKLSIHTVDITDRHAVCPLPDEVKKVHGRIDILINNAGIIQPFIPFAELNYEIIQRIMNINVFGMMYMVRAFLHHLAEQPEAYIANVSSMGGFLPVPGQTLYGASKAAVKLLTEGLRAELESSNIGVSVIMPGGVNTNITKNSGVTQNTATTGDTEKQTARLTTPEQAAAIILNGIKKGKPRILVGKDAKMMDFISRMAPVRAGKTISKMMASLLEERFRDPEVLKSALCLGKEA